MGVKNFFRNGLRRSKSRSSSEEKGVEIPTVATIQQGIARSTTLHNPLSIYNPDGFEDLDGAADEFPPGVQTKTDKVKERVDKLRAAIQSKSLEFEARKTINRELSNLVVKNSSWEVVVSTHRDKFLEDVLASKQEEYENSFGCYESTANFDTRMAITSKWYNETIIHAQKLQTQFKQLEASKSIEIYRAGQMHQEPGALHHIRIERYDPDRSHLCSIGAPYPDMWRAITIGAQGFVPGSWWLNLSCASRDGIINDPMKSITKSTEGPVSAIVLDLGEVSNRSTFDEIEYTIESHNHELLLSQTLIQHGAPIRVILGYHLQGCNYAPRGGFRYDGLYTFGNYSFVTVDATNNVNRATVTLKRYPGQLPIEAVSHIPRPSQLDDWRLYNKMRFHGMKYMDTAPYTPVGSPVKGKGQSRGLN